MEMTGESTIETKKILQEVSDERARQDKKWGEQNHPDGTGDIDQQEQADYARAECDLAAKGGRLTFAHILEEEFWEALAEADKGKLRTELLQVAAVSVAWIEKLDRDAKKESERGSKEG